MGARSRLPSLPPDAPASYGKSLWEAQLAAGSRPPQPAAAAHPASPPLSLAGPGAEEAVEVSCPVPGVRPCWSPQGDARCPAAPLLPVRRGHRKGMNGPDSEP